MVILGLHVIDWLVLVAYLVGMIYIGKWASNKIKNTTDFYQGGRSFGKILFTFLNFGNITNADQATGVSREIYRQGLSGLWFQNLVLFLTPFYWFAAVLQRRTRYMAPGDIYLHRFQSPFLAGLFAIYILLVAIYGGSMGFMLTGKTMKALMVKPESAYTIEDRASVDGYQRFRELEGKQVYTPLTAEEKTEFTLLQERMNRGDLEPYKSYVNINMFYFIYAGIVGIYTILGGLFAAVVTDVVQGLLIVFLSLALIPMGLSRLGGFEGLHRAVPDHMFQLFGSASDSEYTWYFVMSMVVINLIGLAPRSFTIGGSARDDKSARIGMVTGAFAKRFLMIGWALTGLIALGLYQGHLADPTMIWGHMTRDLLGVGFIGMMIAAILAANMSTIDAQSLEWAAAFSKNILLPLRPKVSEKRQIFAGRIVIFIVLLASIFFANRVDDIFVMFKYVLSIGTIIGPPLWLVYFWRRLTTKAVVVQMILTMFTTVIIPNVVPTFDGMRTHPLLTQQTPERVVIEQVQATPDDVRNGYAEYESQWIDKRTVVPSTAIFYEQVVRENPDDLNSPLVGKGAFRNQLYYFHLLGVPLQKLSKPQLATLSFVFDIIFPFLLLFGVSLVTRRNDKRVLNEFYGAVHTPAVADLEEDARLVRDSIEHPEKVEQRKLFPGTDWEFWKPDRWDIWGFIACCALVGVIILLYIVIMGIGA
ncbi:MAG TPA: sodium:solute symporter family protein [bacterium]|nr:sodium:solute symporter family protein [bacterium]HPG47196.1 sodium:solute symporter family protein [bacterium]HPM99464.1 sodium:solute symporter family protein [bacterium]